MSVSVSGVVDMAATAAAAADASVVVIVAAAVVVVAAERILVGIVVPSVTLVCR